MKKVLFLDRDGTLVIEPPSDKQLDSLEKLEFYPGVFQWLSRITKELDYELVMVTNQDGLGSDSFPENDFWPAQNKIIQAFRNEGIVFSDIFIDNSFASDNSNRRKPGTGMLGKYIHGNFNLVESYVVGDRNSDMQLALNLGAQGIYIGKENSLASFTSQSWEDIYRFLKKSPRYVQLNRTTTETKINLELNLDGSGLSDINTGLGFFDHMLEQIAKHAYIDIDLKVEGDLEVDEHHTIEDTAILLGAAICEGLGTKKSIERYGFVLPMDDCLAQVALDFSGRPWLVWDVDFKREYIGKLPTEMFFHFFKSFCDSAKCNLNISAKGTNEHHKIESVFKAFAKSLKVAISKNESSTIPSTKGIL